MLATSLLSACAGGDLKTLTTSSLAPSPGGSATPTTATAAGKADAPIPAKQAARDYRANPGNPAVAIAFARALRAKGEKKRALAILAESAKTNPGNRRLAAERGMLSLELGQLANAETHLKAALDPARPDWRIHSALGSALASAGKHPQAQRQFAKALTLKPDHPSILNNLALSYALDGKADAAKKMLTVAAAGRASSPRVQKNLALVQELTAKPGAARRSADRKRVAGKTSPSRNEAVYTRRLDNPTRDTGRTQVSRADAAATSPASRISQAGKAAEPRWSVPTSD